MTQKQTFYWKQAKNGLIAHLYEHIASSFITGELTRKSAFFVADFDHWARTYGTVLYLDFNAHSKESSRLLHRAVKDFSKSTITSEQLLLAANQISAEYSRPVSKLDESLLEEITEFHKQRWQIAAQLPAFQADAETSVNTVFSVDSITYGRQSAVSITSRTLHFEINESLYAKNPAKKALAVLVVQALALNIHRALDDAYPYYDNGDQWDYAADTVAYRTELLFQKKAAPSNETLQFSIDTWKRAFETPAFSRQLAKNIRNNYKNESAQYFSYATMNEITGGILIGYAGWKSVAKPALIQKFVEATSISIVDEEA